MKKKILIIGKKSFLGSNLSFFLTKKKVNTRLINFENFFKNYKFYNENYDLVVNCSSNKFFINNKYNAQNDNNLRIANKLLKSKTKLLTISTRKIYKQKFNTKESDTKKPKCNYSKNNLISERSVSKTLKKRSLVLRVSNIIGLPKNHNRKLHRTFNDVFFDKAKLGYIYDNKNIYKDFISIKKFNEITFELIKEDASGPYNVSLGKKVYINQITKWLNYHNKKKIIVIQPKKSFNDDSFTLNNNKLMNKIKLKNNFNELKNECISISKKFFQKK